MIKEDITIYKLLVIAFLIIALGLGYMNFYYLKDIENINYRQTSGRENLKIEDTSRKYGYSDIFDLINKDENIEVNSISSSGIDKSHIEINMNYYGNISELYDTLNDFKGDGSLYSVENITLNKNSDEKQNITFTAVFIKNK